MVWVSNTLLFLQVRGRFATLDNPSKHFSLLQPLKGCGKTHRHHLPAYRNDKEIIRWIIALFS